MKALFTTLVFVFISTFAMAQFAMVDTNSSAEPCIKTTRVLSPAKQARIAKKQNKSVSKQLQDFVKTQIDYSEVMAENGMEGIVLVQVNISDKGVISALKVVDSPNNVMTDETLKAMKGLVGLSVSESDYFGYNKIRIPVEFSIR